VKLLIFGGGFFILRGERGVMAKEGLWMVPNDANSVCSVINAESKPFDSKQLDEVTRQFR
jgi:hypothetical protein